MMKGLVAAALCASALAGPARAAAPVSAAPAAARDLPPISSDLAPYLHLSGLLGMRYLYQPSLRRETIEYLYFVNAKANVLRGKVAGLAVQASFDSFDRHKYLKGFASAGSGDVNAEPIFNFNRLFLDGYASAGESRLTAQFGVIPLELPSIQLPVELGQVGTLSGGRASVASGPWRFSGTAANQRTDLIQDVDYRFDGVRRRYNYLDFHGDRVWEIGTTRLGIIGSDTKRTGFRDTNTVYFAHQDLALFDGAVIPRLDAYYLPATDEFADVMTSVDGRFLDRKLSIRPGFVHTNRNPKIVHLQNSNYFTPGIDRNYLTLNVAYPFPRSADILYAALTTGAKRFIAQQETRFEGGFFLFFSAVPFLP